MLLWRRQVKRVRVGARGLDGNGRRKSVGASASESALGAMRVGSLRVLGARVVAAGARTASPGSRSSVLRMATQGWQRSRWRGTCASAAPHLCANSAAQLPVAGLEQAAHPACCDGAARIEVSAVSAEDDDDADTM